MSSDLVISSLAERLHHACLDQETWPDALTQVATAFGADHIVLRGPVQVTEGTDAGLTVGLDNRSRERFFSRRATELMAPLAATVSPSLVVMQEELIPFDQLQRTPLFDEIIRPANGRHSLYARQDLSAGGFDVMLCRSRRSGDFSASDKRALQHLFPHLVTAMEFTRRLMGAEARASSLARLIDSLDSAVILTDGLGQVVFANHRAKPAVEEIQRLLRPSAREDQAPSSAGADLRRMEARAAKDPAATRTRLRLPPTSKREQMLVDIMPMAGAGVAPHGWGAPRVAIFIQDQPAKVTLDHDVLRHFYALAPRECEVVSLLTAGLTPKTIALRLGLSIGTVRFYLKDIFRKTETHSQSALVTLMRRLNGRGAE